MLFLSKSQDEDSQMMTEVDLFISTKAVKVLNADTQVSKSSCCVCVDSASLLCEVVIVNLFT